MLNKMNGLTSHQNIGYHTNKNANLTKETDPTAASSSNEVTLNSFRLNQRLNSLNTDADRIGLLNRANNGGRPPTSVRPTTTGGPRSATINFYNNSRGPQREDKNAPNFLDNYQIGKVVGQGAYAQVRLCMDKRN